MSHCELPHYAGPNAITKESLVEKLERTLQPFLFCTYLFVPSSACLSFRAQDVFKQALQTNRIQLRIIRAEAPPLPKQPPPLLPRSEKQNARNLNLSKNSVPSPIKLEDLMPAKQVCQLVESVP